MVLFFKKQSKIQHNWESVTMAIFKKYPNPFASHVLSDDVIERRIDNLGRLITTRLFTKQGKLPKWGLNFFNISQAYILETSTVDPTRGEMVVTTRNLSHSKLLLVQETSVISRLQNQTLMSQKTRFVSNSSFIPIRSRIESWGRERFEKTSQNSFKGLLHVLQGIK